MIAKFLNKFVGEGNCPFCKDKLIPINTKNKLQPLECKNPCIYYPVLRSVLNQEQQYNVLELVLHEAKCRVWITNTKNIRITKIGEHQHITCIMLPNQQANLDDMDKFTHRCKTILTFS